MILDHQKMEYYRPLLLRNLRERLVLKHIREEMKRHAPDAESPDLFQKRHILAMEPDSLHSQIMLFAIPFCVDLVRALSYEYNANRDRCIFKKEYVFYLSVSFDIAHNLEPPQGGTNIPKSPISPWEVGSISLEYVSTRFVPNCESLAGNWINLNEARDVLCCLGVFSEDAVGSRIMCGFIDQESVGLYFEEDLKLIEKLGLPKSKIYTDLNIVDLDQGKSHEQNIDDFLVSGLFGNNY